MITDLETMNYMFMIDVQRDECKLHDVTMSTDDVVKCYKKKASIYDRQLPAKRYFHVNTLSFDLGSLNLSNVTGTLDKSTFQYIVQFNPETMKISLRVIVFYFLRFSGLNINVENFIHF